MICLECGDRSFLPVCATCREYTEPDPPLDASAFHTGAGFLDASFTLKKKEPPR